MTLTLKKKNCIAIEKKCGEKDRNNATLFNYIEQNVLYPPKVVHNQNNEKRNWDTKRKREMESNNYSDVCMDVVVFAIFSDKSTG